jgi:hypothetical protein
VKDASVDDIAALPGFSRASALKVLRALGVESPEAGTPPPVADAAPGGSAHDPPVPGHPEGADGPETAAPTACPGDDAGHA